MVCIYCSGKTKVSNSRSSAKAIMTWRRRECLGCKAVVTTREQIDLREALRVSDGSNRLQPFQRDKLLISLHSGLTHRKSALTDATELTDTVISRLMAVQSKGIVDTKEIAAAAYRTLEKFDPVSGVHYQAHYFKKK
jgi:transcriptional repressor NrdR